MTTAEIKRLQEDLNKFTRTYLKGLGRIRVDGKLGASTNGRIKTVKFHLGYKRPLNDTADHAFRMRMRYPRRRKYSSASRIALGLRRRVASRARWARTIGHASVTSGVGRFDGRPCAKWLIPYLHWARVNGWRGTLNSGWRDPAYSESLCRRICGRPSCPGRCAGRASNHSGSVKPRGAVDVSDYVRFSSLMRQCPYSPRIFNALGAQDPVHFSATGR